MVTSQTLVTTVTAVDPIPATPRLRHHRRRGRGPFQHGQRQPVELHRRARPQPPAVGGRHAGLPGDGLGRRQCRRLLEPGADRSGSRPIRCWLPADISYYNAIGGVYVDLPAQIGQRGDVGASYWNGPAAVTPIAVDYFSGVHDATGSAFDDLLVGGTTSGRLNGLDGNDLIYGNSSQAAADAAAPSRS